MALETRVSPAVQAIEATFGIAHSLDTEPFPASQRIRFAGQRYALDAIERLLCHSALTEAQLGRLEAAISDAYDPNAMIRSLPGEQCMFLEVFARPELIDPEFFRRSTPQAILEAYNASGLAAREGIVFLDTMEVLIQAVRLATYCRQGAYETAVTRFRTCSAQGILVPGDLNWVHVVIDEPWCLVRLRIVAAVLAIERYRLKKGDWPKTLTDLVPEYLQDVPEDPFDGVPLRYQRLDGGFIVYSVGWDRIDDGGRAQLPLKERKPDETYDIAFTVER